MKIVFSFFVLFSSLLFGVDQEITPYKYTDQLPAYEAPASSTFTLHRNETSAPNITYYLSKPQSESFPILIFLGGSSNKDNASSIIHVHRYFLKEILDLNIALITVEQWGVDSHQIDKEEFIQHYTRSQRLQDHQTVIDHLKTHPIAGWNGKFIFLGVSEGGPIATHLTEDYNSDTLATILWSGAGDMPWREELWAFMQNLLKENPKCPHQVFLNECLSCSKVFTNRCDYDQLMNHTLLYSDTENDFLNMTYLYHADALNFPTPDYQKLSKPLLVVSGALDSCIESSDLFVLNAQEYGVDVTYMRIADMDHYVRKRPDITQATFDWLKKQLHPFNQ